MPPAIAAPHRLDEPAGLRVAVDRIEVVLDGQRIADDRVELLAVADGVEVSVVEKTERDFLRSRLEALERILELERLLERGRDRGVVLVERDAAGPRRKHDRDPGAELVDEPGASHDALRGRQPEVRADGIREPGLLDFRSFLERRQVGSGQGAICVVANLRDCPEWVLE